MKNICPECQSELSWDIDAYHCLQCEQYYVKNAFCDKCDDQLEKLKACGAVNYFCDHCSELKSKSNVRFEFSVK